MIPALAEAAKSISFVVEGHDLLANYDKRQGDEITATWNECEQI